MVPNYGFILCFFAHPLLTCMQGIIARILSCGVHPSITHCANVTDTYTYASTRLLPTNQGSYIEQDARRALGGYGWVLVVKAQFIVTGTAGSILGWPTRTLPAPLV